MISVCKCTICVVVREIKIVGTKINVGVPPPHGETYLYECLGDFGVK